MIPNNFPIGVQNHPTVDSFEKEKTIISLIDNSTSYLTVDTYGYGLISFSVANNLSSVKVSAQSSNDNSTWKDVQPISLMSMPSNLSAASGNPYVNQPGNNSYQLPKCVALALAFFVVLSIISKSDFILNLPFTFFMLLTMIIALPCLVSTITGFLSINEAKAL